MMVQQKISTRAVLKTMENTTLKNNRAQHCTDVKCIRNGRAMSNTLARVFTALKMMSGPLVRNMTPRARERMREGFLMSQYVLV